MADHEETNSNPTVQKAGKLTIDSTIAYEGRNYVITGIEWEHLPEGGLSEQVRFDLEDADGTEYVTVFNCYEEVKTLEPSVYPNPAELNVYGPGIAPTGNLIGNLTKFWVTNASEDRLCVSLRAPDGLEQQFNLVETESDMTYTYTYKPIMVGTYEVFVAGEGFHHEFKVEVENNPKMCLVKGRGIRSEIIVNEIAYFEVGTKDAGKGKVDVSVYDDQKQGVPFELNQQSEDLWIVRYTPTKAVPHLMCIKFDGEPIPGSPFSVEVARGDDQIWRATGPGLEPHGVHVGEKAEFMVQTFVEGVSDLNVYLMRPDGKQEDVKYELTTDDNFKCFYTPQQKGNYTICVRYGGEDVPTTRYEVFVDYIGASVKVSGEGEKSGVAGTKAVFYVTRNGETGSLEYQIEGPAAVKIHVEKMRNGSEKITYTPTAPGEYDIHVLCDRKDIPGSPFKVEILPNKLRDASKVKAYGTGLGLTKNVVLTNKWLTFFVSAHQVGNAPLKISCVDEKNNDVTVHVIKSVKSGIYFCRYMPTKNCKHTVSITLGQVHIPKSPFNVNVQEGGDPTKVRAYGPGLTYVYAYSQANFNINTREAGKGNLKVYVQGPFGHARTQSYEKDGILAMRYLTTKSGNYKINIQFNGKHIPGSPFKAKVNLMPKVMPHNGIDVSGVRVYGPRVQSFGVKKCAIFTVNASSVTQNGQGVVKAIVTDFSGKRTSAGVANLKNGLYNIYLYIPSDEVVERKIDITFNGMEIPRSPVHVKVVQGQVHTTFAARRYSKILHDFASKVRVTGDVVKNVEVKTGSLVSFKIDTSEAGAAPAWVYIQNPKGSRVGVNLKSISRGIIAYNFRTKLVGEYKIFVGMAGKSVPGAPFSVKVVG